MTVNKVRRNGSYAPLSAHYYKDDAIAEAGEAAELLYVRGLAFCADVLSDGFISDTQLTRFVGVGMRDTKKRATRLVQVGLWQREKTGYRVVAWLKWNRSRQEIGDLAKRDSERKGNASARDEEANDSEQNPDGIRSDEGTTAAPYPQVTDALPAGSLHEQNRNVVSDAAYPQVTDDEDLAVDPPGDTSKLPEQGELIAFRTESARSPDGIQPRARTPRNSTPRNASSSEPKGSGADAPGGINAGTVVAAWVEAYEGKTGQKPNGSMRAQAGREARKLLEADADPALVLEAAIQAGEGGYATVERQHGPLAARRRGNTAVDPTTGRTVEVPAMARVLRDPKSGMAVER